MSQVNWTDKVNLNPKTSRVNQWWDIDANELKAAVNDNDDRIATLELPASSTSNTTIDFSNPKGIIAGTNLNILSGNITIIDTNAENTNTAICFHQGGKPSFTGGTIIGELGEYATGVVNYFSLIRITPGNYLVSYGGEVKNIITTPSTAPKNLVTTLVTGTAPKNLVTTLV